MTPEDRRAVEEAARRIVAYARWRTRHPQGGASVERAALDVLEAHVGGFNARTVKLAKQALNCAQDHDWTKP